MKTVVELPNELHRKLKVKAAQMNILLTEAAEEAVREWLKAKAAKKEAA